MYVMTIDYSCEYGVFMLPWECKKLKKIRFTCALSYEAHPNNRRLQGYYELNLKKHKRKTKQ